METLKKKKANTKTVQLRELEPTGKPTHICKQDTQKSWKSKQCNHWGKDECNCNVLCYLENAEVNVRSHTNSFYGAFVNAYNNHEDIVLSPDDVWLVISLQFSKYINANSEKLRDQFVSHDGKKKLTVVTRNEVLESEWNEFFNLMVEAIKENTVDGIVDTLKCDFTTTGRVESLISIASIMDSFKSYFSYGRMIPCCGIKAVRFMGFEEDWSQLLEKTKQLAKYDVDGTWAKYIDHMIPILNQFLNTYNEKVDTEFWDKVMNIRYGSAGSGSTTNVSGWILHFFGLYSEVDSHDIKIASIDVPVKIDNKLTGQKKNVNIIGGFGGVNFTDGAYRPQLSMIVFHDGNIE